MSNSTNPVTASKVHGIVPQLVDAIEAEAEPFAEDIVELHAVARAFAGQYLAPTHFRIALDKMGCRRVRGKDRLTLFVVRDADVYETLKDRQVVDLWRSLQAG